MSGLDQNGSLFKDRWKASVTFGYNEFDKNKTVNFRIDLQDQLLGVTTTQMDMEYLPGRSVDANGFDELQTSFFYSTPVRAISSDQTTLPFDFLIARCYLKTN